MAIHRSNPNFTGIAPALNPRQPRAQASPANFAQLLQVLKTNQQKLAHVQNAPTAPAAPSNFTATGVIGGIALSWGAVAKADGYIILRSSIPDFSSLIQIPILHPGQTSYLDSVSDGQTYYYALVATAGTTSQPHITQSLPTSITSARSLATGTFGKNMCPNPGFEENLGGVVAQSLIQTVGAALCDGWYLQSNPDGILFGAQYLNNGSGRNGSNSIFVRLQQNQAIPADGLFHEMRIYTSAHIPVATGDFLRVGAWEKWAASTGFPAGNSGIQRIGFFVYAADGTPLGELAKDLIAPNNAFVWQEVTLQIPATMAGKAPAYIVVQCSAFINDNSGIVLNTGGNLYMDMQWDDVKVVIQSTAFDVTPVNTAYLSQTNGNLLSQSGTSSTVNVAATTIQYADGTVSYNSGTLTAPTNSSTGYVTASDPTYSGGALAFTWNASAFLTVNANGNITYGKITLAAGGGGTGGTGGGGTSQSFCFTPDTRIVTKRGEIAFGDIREDDEVMTTGGWREIEKILIHVDYVGVMQQMIGGGGVTPKHDLCEHTDWAGPDAEWQEAHNFFPDSFTYSGPVLNLHVKTKNDDERNYQLACGLFAHNFQKA